jgi:sortase A
LSKKFLRYASEHPDCWDDGGQRNVYIPGHWLGYPGTASRLVFYNLDKLKSVDEETLKDCYEARNYGYRVSERITAGPDGSWVMSQEIDRDMLTLQTYIPPTFDRPLIVRAVGFRVTQWLPAL